jgi:ABC-2 type transport system ATP-binding protein
MEERPRRVQIIASPARPLGASVAAVDGVEQVEIGDGTLIVETRDPSGLALALPALARDAGVRIDAIEPTDEDLESVYGYLTQRARGVRR